MPTSDEMKMLAEGWRKHCEDTKKKARSLLGPHAIPVDRRSERTVETLKRAVEAAELAGCTVRMVADEIYLVADDEDHATMGTLVL